MAKFLRGEKPQIVNEQNGTRVPDEMREEERSGRRVKIDAARFVRPEG